LGYIPIAESLCISSTTFTQCAANATEFGEKTQNNGHYAVPDITRESSLKILGVESASDHIRRVVSDRSMQKV